MARKISQDILDAIKKRSKVNDSDMTPKEDAILRDVLRLSNKIAIDGKFGPAEIVELSKVNYDSFSDEFKSKISSLFEIKFNEDLKNKLKLYREINEEDLDIYVEALGHDRDYLIKNQEAIIGI